MIELKLWNFNCSLLKRLTKGFIFSKPSWSLAATWQHSLKKWYISRALQSGNHESGGPDELLLGSMFFGFPGVVLNGPLQKDLIVHVFPVEHGEFRAGQVTLVDLPWGNILPGCLWFNPTWLLVWTLFVLKMSASFFWGITVSVSCLLLYSLVLA